jgi:hypothetical protein
LVVVAVVVVVGGLRSLVVGGRSLVASGDFHGWWRGGLGRLRSGSACVAGRRLRSPGGLWWLVALVRRLAVVVFSGRGVGWWGRA